MRRVASFENTTEKLARKMEQESNKKRYEGRSTPEQLRLFINFVQKHPQLIGGKNLSKSKQTVEDLWEELALDLNAMRGPSRHHLKWKENLLLWRNQLRCRGKKQKANMLATGGDSETYGLSEFEEVALKVLGVEPVDGGIEVKSMGFEELDSSEDTVATKHVKTLIEEDDDDDNDDADDNNDTFHSKVAQESKKKKVERSTPEQLRYYINFVQNHPQILSRKSCPNYQKIQIRNLWKKLADGLNALRGPSRDPMKWKENFSYWKNQLSCRARKLKAHMLATGGDFAANGLSEFEELALSVLGCELIGEVNAAKAVVGSEENNSSQENTTLKHDKSLLQEVEVEEEDEEEDEEQTFQSNTTGGEDFKEVQTHEITELDPLEQTDYPAAKRRRMDSMYDKLVESIKMRRCSDKQISERLAVMATATENMALAMEKLAKSIETMTETTKRKSTTVGGGNESLGRVVNNLEKDEAAIFAEGWALQYRKLDEDQKLFAKRMVDDALIQGQMRLLSFGSGITTQQQFVQGQGQIENQYYSSTSLNSTKGSDFP